MRRLVFIDDDRAELEAFRKIVGGDYDYGPVHWPVEAAKLFSGPGPDIFVSDLYLPSSNGDSTPTGAQRDAAALAAKEVAERFSGLYASKSGDDKARLQETMKAICAAYAMLKLQWSALGQSPDHGVELLSKLKSLYPEVPFVFYSRKITPEDVIRVLQAGAVDAVRKGALEDEEVRARLATAQGISTGDSYSNRGSTPRPKMQTSVPQEVSSATTGEADVVLSRPEVVNRWLGMGTKAFGLGTAVLAFMLARGKLVEWFHGSRVPSVLSPTSGSGILAILVGLYLLVYLLFVTGGVLQRIFAELLNGILFALRSIPSVKAKLTGKISSALESVPKLFGLAWDACVIAMAVVPAVRYTIHLLASP
jgi:DNA-binding NarL/FixJ family response regulator